MHSRIHLYLHCIPHGLGWKQQQTHLIAHPNAILRSGSNLNHFHCVKIGFSYPFFPPLCSASFSYAAYTIHNWLLPIQERTVAQIPSPPPYCRTKSGSWDGQSCRAEGAKGGGYGGQPEKERGLRANLAAATRWLLHTAVTAAWKVTQNPRIPYL